MQPKQMRRTALMSWVMVLVTACWTNIALAAFESGSTGADGAFEPTANIALQIPESGVLNYTTVTIPTGVTVTFKKNSQNTPVTILATGDVTINGSINLDGSAGNYIIPGAGGPGGFDGGQGGAAYGIGKRGEGTGGGAGGGTCTTSDAYSAGGGGGGFGANGSGGGQTGYCNTSGGAGGSSYSNERILPAIGGSGGGGAGGTNTYVGGGGGGGGGAVVLASSGTITVNGTISANGGTGATPSTGQARYSGGGGGSGGSIRLISNTISGNGSITANGGGGGNSYYGGNGGSGAVGRIRFEASNVLRTAATSPPLSLGYPYAVTPPNMPSLTISSIGGVSSPTVPKGAYGAPDVMLPFNTKNPITIVVTGSNIPTGQTVTVKASPSVGSATSASATLEGTEASSSASLSLSIATAYPSIITASVTFQLSAANGAPIYAMGELVEKVRVSSALGGKSLVTYITASGKEVQLL